MLSSGNMSYFRILPFLTCLICYSIFCIFMTLAKTKLNLIRSSVAQQYRAYSLEFWQIYDSLGLICMQSWEVKRRRKAGKETKRMCCITRSDEEEQ